MVEPTDPDIAPDEPTRERVTRVGVERDAQAALEAISGDLKTCRLRRDNLNAKIRQLVQDEAAMTRVVKSFEPRKKSGS